MKPEKLLDIKKELLAQDIKQLAEICLRMAKYKKENKELLNYLLFRADDPMDYAEALKASLDEDFKTLQRHYYYSVKALRKILRIMNRHIKFTASRQVEIELAIWFCKNFLAYADTRSSHKPLRAIFIRQMERIQKLMSKLHEDLQFDYRIDFEGLIAEAEIKVRDFPKRQFNAL